MWKLLEIDLKISDNKIENIRNYPQNVVKSVVAECCHGLQLICCRDEVTFESYNIIVRVLSRHIDVKVS